MSYYEYFELFFTVFNMILSITRLNRLSSYLYGFSAISKITDDDSITSRLTREIEYSTKFYSVYIINNIDIL